MNKFTNSQIEEYLIDCRGYSQEDINDSHEDGGPGYLMSDDDWKNIEEFNK